MTSPDTCRQAFLQLPSLGMACAGHPQDAALELTGLLFKASSSMMSRSERPAFAWTTSWSRIPTQGNVLTSPLDVVQGAGWYLANA